MKLNRKQVAECFGCSLPTVDTWRDEGCPVLGGGGKGVAVDFDSAAVHAWLVKKAKSNRRTRGNRFGEGDDGPAEGEITIEEAKRRHEVAKAKTAELELAEAMGLLAPVEVFAKVVADQVANARARLLAIPSKLRPVAEICSKDAERAKRLVNEVDDLVRDALTEIKEGSGS